VDSDLIADRRAITKAPPWHGWVTADLFLLSLASGTFTVAALFALLRPHQTQPLVRIAFLCIFPVMLADLACLIIDLGDPARFHHMLRTFKPGSPMSIGVWTIAILSFISFLAFAATLLRLDPLIIQIVAAMGLPPALIAGAYKGVLFSATAQPGWRRMRSLGAAFAFSSIAMGAAVMIAISLAEDDAHAERIARFILMWLLVFNALSVRRVMGRGRHPLRPIAGAIASAATDPETVGLAKYLASWRHMSRSSSAERNTPVGHLSDVLDERAASRISLHYAIFIIGGLGLPIVLCALSNGSPITDVVIVAIVLSGAFASRHYLVTAPHKSASDES
jgi:formate-dependent nitrite reductase membrane component NrfD